MDYAHGGLIPARGEVVHLPKTNAANVVAGAAFFKPEIYELDRAGDAFLPPR